MGLDERRELLVREGVALVERTSGRPGACSCWWVGKLGSILLLSAALGVFAAAPGTVVSFSDLIVVIISVSLLAGLLPIPGGIGVVESGITFGLVAAGMPEGAAFTAVILYRVATFYLPPGLGVSRVRMSPLEWWGLG